MFLFDEFQRQAMGMACRSCERTVTGGIGGAQSIVPAVKHKKIYCKPAAYQ